MNPSISGPGARDLGSGSAGTVHPSETAITTPQAQQSMPICSLDESGPHGMVPLFEEDQMSRSRAADGLGRSHSDPGCVETLRGISAPGILSPVVTRRARKRKNLSSARHYDQIRFRFRTAKTQCRSRGPLTSERPISAAGCGCRKQAGRPRLAIHILRGLEKG